MRSFLIVLAAGAAVLAAAGPVPGHSLLLDATPAPGATLAAPPATVSLRFNSRVETRLSSLRLVGGTGPARVLSVADAPGAPDRLTATLPALGPGRYRLEWRVLSVDGHVASGSFDFRVVP